MPELVLTPEQQERMGRLPLELQREYRRVLELTMWRERSRKLEGPRIPLPPDNTRWGASAPTPHAEPPRPSGWQPFTPLTTQPGIDIIDRMVEADTARQRADAIAAERMRRQAIIDAFAEAKLDEKEYRREQAERRSFHKAPGDADWDSK
jgi:hypothetical protein